jgi:prevent-host-death family protein
MTTMNIAEAKSKLSELVARAEAGEEVVIARNGKPSVRLQPVEPMSRRKPVLGAWEHLKINVPDAVFFEPDPDLEALMDAPIDPARR